MQLGMVLPFAHMSSKNDRFKNNIPRNQVTPKTSIAAIFPSGTSSALMFLVSFSYNFRGRFSRLIIIKSASITPATGTIFCRADNERFKEKKGIHFGNSIKHVECGNPSKWY
ncbi:unnamed protein product [Hermetia illucens]|uniref:Uncharacterized protein n=1 Tax=Hermetia illucens TaxID=343691 RepID=A0A7R8UY74_HERIL|nr:unnamed protein product [Hermetia illucens]